MATDLDERIARLALTDGLHAIAYALLQLAETTGGGAGRDTANSDLSARLAELDDKIDAMTRTLIDRFAELDDKIGALDDKIDDTAGTLSDRLGDLMDRSIRDE